MPLLKSPSRPAHPTPAPTPDVSVPRLRGNQLRQCQSTCVTCLLAAIKLLGKLCRSFEPFFADVRKLVVVVTSREQDLMEVCPQAWPYPVENDRRHCPHAAITALISSLMVLEGLNGIEEYQIKDICRDYWSAD